MSIEIIEVGCDQIELIVADKDSIIINTIDDSDKVIVNVLNPSNPLGTLDHTKLFNIGVNTHPEIDSHISNLNNPHQVTKAQVGLSEVDNTSDLNKPISIATQAALNGKYDQPTGNINQYIRGDGSIVNFPETVSLITNVFNLTGSTIPAGKVVYINGAHGNLPTIALAQANNEPTSSKTYGMTQTAIDDNKSGTIIAFGLVPNLNTSSLTEGVALYLSPTVPGDVTTIKPVAPNHMVFIGFCTRAHPTQGTIELKIQNGFELDELHNVLISSVANGQVLRYNSASSLWVNYSLTKADIGLSEVDNTSDANKPISSATQTALNAKQPTLVSGTNIKTINGNSILGSGDLNVGGSAVWGGITGNLSDQVDLQAALNAKQNSLGYTAENAANKATTLTSPDNVKYPTTQAVSTALAGKQNSLGFTPENVANKETTALDTSTTKYPSNSVVKAAVDAKADASALSSHVSNTSNPHSVTKSQVGLGNVPNVDATNPANIVQTASYRFVTDTEKSTWNGKQDALGFTPENVSNKENTTLDTSSTKYPTNNLVKTYVDTGLSAKQNSLGFTPENVANKEVAALDTSTTKYPANAVVKAAVDSKQNTLISGTNIKTINGSSVLGSGNLVVTGGGGLGDSFETVSKNLKAYNYSLNYTGGVLDEMVYDLGGVLTVYKSFNYNLDGSLASIVLSGDIPSGITTTKTLTYTGGNLSGIAYS